MLWDNIYKPYCASTAVAAFWRQHALKTWQNISRLPIIKDDTIHFPLVLQLKASNSIFCRVHRYVGQFMNLGLAQVISSAEMRAENNTFVLISWNYVSIHIIAPKRKLTFIHMAFVDLVNEYGPLWQEEIIIFTNITK